MSGETVLVSCIQLQHHIDEFRQAFSEREIKLLTPPIIQQLTEDELLPIIGEVDGMIAGDDHLTRIVLEHALRLRVIAKWGVGTDAIDLDAASDLGIRVSNTPGVLGDEVADVVIGYIVMLTRSLHLVDHDVRNGKWSKPEGRSLAGQTIGVVGLGSIGQAVCRRAMAMGMRVIGTDIAEPAAEAAAAIGVEVAELGALVETADVISLNCPLTPDNQQFVNGDLIRRMKRGARLVNTARGGLVDEVALAEALDSGHLGGAALDVFEVEPLPQGSPLRSRNDVILGSHNASNTTEAIARTSALAVRNVLAGLDEVRR